MLFEVEPRPVEHGSSRLCSLSKWPARNAASEAVNCETDACIRWRRVTASLNAGNNDISFITMREGQNNLPQWYFENSRRNICGIVINANNHEIKFQGQNSRAMHSLAFVWLHNRNYFQFFMRSRRKNISKISDRENSRQEIFMRMITRYYNMPGPIDMSMIGVKLGSSMHCPQ